MVDEALTFDETGASMENDVVKGFRPKELKLKLAENESEVEREAELSFFGQWEFAMKSVQLVRRKLVTLLISEFLFFRIIDTINETEQS